MRFASLRSAGVVDGAYIIRDSSAVGSGPVDISSPLVPGDIALAAWMHVKGIGTVHSAVVGGIRRQGAIFGAELRAVPDRIAREQESAPLRAGQVAPGEVARSVKPVVDTEVPDPHGVVLTSGNE